MNLIATLVRWACIWAVFAAMGLVLIVCLPFATPRGLFPISSRMFGWMVRCAGIRVTVVGRERLNPGTGYVYMIHHASVLDHFVLASTVPEFLVGIEKESNFKVPVYGWMTRWWGNIPIVREEREKAFAAMEIAKKAMRSGVSVGIAPEGTRMEGGVLGPFKKGGFHLARDTGASIVPVALVGMHERNPDRKFRLVGGPLRVEFHAPIPSDAGTIDELITRVRERLVASGIREPAQLSGRS